MILRSIKWRLQAWHGLLLVLLVAGLMTGFYGFERRARLQAVDALLREASTPLLPRYAPPVRREMESRESRGRRPPPPEEDGVPFAGPPPDDGPPRGERLRQGAAIVEERDRAMLAIGSKIYFVAWDENGERIGASSNAPTDIAPPDSSNREGGRLLRTRGTNREFINFVPTGRSVLVGISLEPTFAELRKLGLALTAIGVGIVVVGLGVGWWAASRALRPIAVISQTAQVIAAGELSKRINTDETQSELGRLAAVLNSTFARLEAAFAQQKQFTSDASHELRTPVSVILTQTQSTLAKPRSAEEYRETVESCQRAAQRMRRLIESLLELARLDAGQEKIKHLRFDLAKTAHDCVELVQPLAGTRNIKIHSDFAPAECEGDSERMAQVITNLLTNAINYNNEGGEVRISTCNGHGAAIVTIADDGPGVSGEQLPRIFERFYRADSARTTGRSGLGLAICKAIVDAHGGSIEVSSKPGAGATFTVSLPAFQSKGS